MKLGRRHMIGSLLLLAASIVWNVWVFSQPASVEPITAAVGGASEGRASAVTVPVDPSSIPPPPPLDLSQRPVWAGNPFERPQESVVPEPPAVAPAETAPPAEPKVSVILYSAGRRAAVIDGRIVAVGDGVAGGVVRDIARHAVTVDFPDGTRKRLSLDDRAAGRTP